MSTDPSNLWTESAPAEPVDEGSIDPTKSKDFEVAEVLYTQIVKSADALCKQWRSAAIAKPIDLTAFRAEVLSAHNKYRSVHGVAPLMLSSKLNDLSQEWADHLIKTGKFERRPIGSGVGENVYKEKVLKPSRIVTGTEVVADWYKEIKDYKFGRPDGFSVATGHFTQVVWKGSSEIGVGYAQSQDGTIMVVVDYNPGGNMSGLFNKNVFPKK